MRALVLPAILCAVLWNTVLDVRGSQALSRAGDLDPTFGGTGKVTVDRGATLGIQEVSMAIQADGKIVLAANYSTLAIRDFRVTRFHEDGSLDTSFGNQGTVTTDFGGEDVASDVAIQTDGKIVVVGQGGIHHEFAVARYNLDGTLDSSFDFDGRVIVGFGSFQDPCTSLSIQGNGRIVLFGGYDVGPAQATGFGQFAMTRLLPNGQIDPVFGINGKVYTDFGSLEVIWAGAIRPDGGLIAAGQSGCQGCNGTSFALAAYNQSGRLNESFGTSGKVVTSYPCPLGVNSDYAKGVAIQGDGKIVAAGYSTRGGEDCRGIDFLLARYASDGTLDPSFGVDGKVQHSFSEGSATGQGVALQSNGKILVPGYVRTSSDGFDFALARYRSNGDLDPYFGTRGTVHTDFGGSTDLGRAIAIQRDGKILVAGTAGGNLALARYLASGPIDEVEALIEDVQVLVQAGSLAGDNANGLVNKLEAIIQKIDKEHVGPAVNQLSAFIDQVGDYVDAGALSPEDGQALIDAAQSIIASLGAPKATASGSSGPSEISAFLDLGQNTPNPFNAKTLIRFELPLNTEYSLSIYDVAGHRVRRYDGVSHGRETTLEWDGTDGTGRQMGAGVYFYEILSAGARQTRRMLLTR